MTTWKTANPSRLSSSRRMDDLLKVELSSPLSPPPQAPSFQHGDSVSSFRYFSPLLLGHRRYNVNASNADDSVSRHAVGLVSMQQKSFCVVLDEKPMSRREEKVVDGRRTG